MKFQDIPRYLTVPSGCTCLHRQSPWAMLRRIRPSIDHVIVIAPLSSICFLSKGTFWNFPLLLLHASLLVILLISLCMFQLSYLLWLSFEFSMDSSPRIHCENLFFRLAFNKILKGYRYRLHWLLSYSHFCSFAFGDCDGGDQLPANFDGKSTIIASFWTSSACFCASDRAKNWLGLI